MEKELDPDVIKATQSSLGKYVKRPPLSEKLLKKPPFRFLHDIVTTVVKTTGFFEGLFEEEELVSDNVKDRESKILFLTKVITVLGYATGKSLAVKPSKIVAGQEPDKTNELLQYLAQALDKKISSDDAVKKYKDKAKSPQSNDTKAKETIKALKKSSDVKKLTSKSSEKLTSQKKDTGERSIKNDKDKVSISKNKQKENSTIKKEPQPKKTSQQTKIITKNNSVEKIPQQQNENLKHQNKKIALSDNTDYEDDIQKVRNNENNDQHEDPGILLEKHDISETTTALQQTTVEDVQDEQVKLNTSYTINEIDLNSSLSSQDLLDVDNEKAKENQLQDPNINITIEEKKIDNHDTEESYKFKFNSEAIINEGEPESQKVTDKSNTYDTNTKPDKIEKIVNDRPSSVRPSSSRPGAPRLREKHDNIVTSTENRLVGKVNIIVENTLNEEEEDSSIIIVDQQAGPLSMSQDNQEQLQLTSNQHGHLVQQILDSQKEFSQVTGKTEIEWQFGAQKAREAVNQEIEQLRFNIQALSRVANPLGKLLDHIQEDVEVMRQELQQWTKSYEEATKELVKQKTANEDSLFPLRTKLKQLDADVEEKRDKINDLKIVLHKNSSRIEKLLASGTVQ